MVANEKIPELLTSHEMHALKELITRLRIVFGEQILEAYLFGSKARGDAKSDSYVDLLLLVDKESWTLKDQISDQVADINLEYDLQLDLRVIGAERWKHMVEIQAGLYPEISRDAIAVAW